jgi:hypothetical protein
VLLRFGESMLVLRAEGTPGTISHFMFGVETVTMLISSGLGLSLLAWIRRRIPTASTFATSTA